MTATDWVAAGWLLYFTALVARRCGPIWLAVPIMAGAVLCFGGALAVLWTDPL